MRLIYGVIRDFQKADEIKNKLCEIPLTNESNR